MLSSLLSSAFIIYLYRSLKGESGRQAAGSRESGADDLGSAVDILDQRLAALEARLTRADDRETAR